MDPYDPIAVEAKWQKKWEELDTNSFTAEQLRNVQNPYYNLMMFPYPSAEGLHIGNIFAYTGADVRGRFERLRGKTVFEPIGFDSFGIHSENFALKMGINPNELVPQNIANFTRQLRRMGGMFDWKHTVNTSDPEYYKWTQWLFVKLFNAGLIYRKEAAVNWCPGCNTVLANEQVIAGLCERCDSVVEQRQLEQWFMNITQYAERLLKNIDSLDWSETAKVTQRNWIGASEGATIQFSVENSDESIEVFTTRPDTLFGATYMVLAPEHALVDSLTTSDERDTVQTYLDEVRKKDLVERQKVDQDKTGVFTGSYCINPVNDERVPVWVSEYVLIEYGTGAIMAVPAHDQRDFEFATKFNLPIRRVISGPDGDVSDALQEAWVGDGKLVNSGSYNGLTVADAKKGIVSDLSDRGVAEAGTSYRLHDWCISRQRYWGPPIPIIFCDACGPVAVPEEDLPVLLPYLDDFKPNDQGESPLSRDESWCNTDCPKCGSSARRETDVSDTFLDSAWYFLRYPSTDTDAEAFQSHLIEKWLPVDSYIGGLEHAVLHLLYARFITMALHDLKLLPFEEPFTTFRAHGILLHEGRKMAKRRGNVIVPDALIEQFGADTVRMYLMFSGPFQQGGDFQEHGIHGPQGFLNRLWQSVNEAVDEEPDLRVLQALHRTIDQVSRSISSLRFNTAVAAMMEYLNVARAEGRTPRIDELKPLVIMVAPFCPHIAEELYERTGQSGSVFSNASWPTADETMLLDEYINVAVQVNGKFRATVQARAGATQDEVEELAMEQPNVLRHVENREIRKTIYVADRMLSIVVA